MIVKVQIVGDRALVTGQPGSGVAFEESAARLRVRFGPAEAQPHVGYFVAEIRNEGASDDPTVTPVLAEICDVGERVRPKETW